jgi:hypothetical protein
MAIFGAVVAAALGCEKDREGSNVPSGPIPPTTVVPVTFAENSGVPDDVKKECHLETRIPEWVAENAKGAAPGAAGASGRVLTMEIKSLMGTGGGAWSGPKQILMEGTLTENGQTIANFTARRTSGGGAWGGYKGTCSILEICGEELGEDIGKWLRAPTMDAKLGELEDDDDDDD